MQKIGGIILVLLLGFPIILAAQHDDPSAPDIEIDWDIFAYDLYVRGDQTFIISLGTTFPAVFWGYHGSVNSDNVNLRDNYRAVGGSGSLIYNYYLGSRFFLGGEITGMFIGTLNHQVFIVPLGMRAGTQFIQGRFEFPVSLSLGMVWQTYLDYGHYSMYMKANASAFFRATSQWSFGLSANWGWFPQWTRDRDTNRRTPRYDVHGNFVNLHLAARYHF
ncbi:MAG: hypothetical protein FWC97_09895 [Treponema sp.]|nr:hypothetical protein [Treponema sp.]